MTLHSLHGAYGLLALSMFVFSTSACVTRGSFDEVIGERDALVAERVGLRDRVDGLIRERETRMNEIASLTSLVEERGQHLDLHEDEIAELRRTQAALERRFVDEIAAEKVKLEQMIDGLRVALAQDILFASGSAELDAEGRELLVAVSKELARNPYGVFVTGHTDDVPIGSRIIDRFPTNWELGAARAARVVRLFEEVGIDPKRLVASSLGLHRPIASNDDEAGRSRNRRIDIRLRPLRLPE